MKFEIKIDATIKGKEFLHVFFYRNKKDKEHTYNIANTIPNSREDLIKVIEQCVNALIAGYEKNKEPTC